MHVLLAFDKFKDSMPARVACARAAEGVREALGDGPTLVHAPLTDGGEGFGPILSEAAGGWVEWHEVCGPLGDWVQAPLGWVEWENLSPAAQRHLPATEGRIALIEMASAAGLEQVPPARRHPRHCTTRGIGDLIRIATAQEATAVLLGIGGSATSDLGLGALEALGFSFPGAEGITPSQWPNLRTIAREPFPAPPIFIACDVDNPLCGPKGAARVYGPQKGLAPHEVEAFDKEAEAVADLLCRCTGRPSGLKDVPGSGAAGGIGFGLKVAFDATFVPGFSLVADWLDLDRKIAAADLILSGEGKIDRSSLSGKGPCTLARAAIRNHKACRLFAGYVEPTARKTIEDDLAPTTVEAISPPGRPLAESLATGPANLRRAVAHSLRRRPPDP